MVVQRLKIRKSVESREKEKKTQLGRKRGQRKEDEVSFSKGPSQEK